MPLILLFISGPAFQLTQEKILLNKPIEMYVIFQRMRAYICFKNHVTFRGQLFVLVIHSVTKYISLVLRIFSFNMREDIYCYFFQSFPIHLNLLILLESAPRENNELFGAHIIRRRDDLEMVTPRFKRFRRVSHLWKAKSFFIF